jgi:Ca2+-binding RTX toxin-like protein
MRRAILLLTVMAATLVVASGVALAVTTQAGPGNDIVLGTDGPDDLGGGYGSDIMNGGSGKDVLGGGYLVEPPRNEGRPNNDDVMNGGSGNDFMYGDLGADQILSGAGDDFLLDGEFRGGAYDVLVGSSGDDVLYPHNFKPAGQDLAVCGAGTDVAYIDHADVVVGCEKVVYSFIPEAQFNQYLAERGLQGRV